MITEFANRLIERGKSQRTVRSYVGDIRCSIKAEVIDINLSVFNESKFMSLKLSPSSMHRYVSSLKKYGKFLLYKGLITSIPKELLYIELPPIKNKLCDLPTIQQFNNLLSSCNLEIKCILRVLYATGCRIDSLANVKKEDIYETYIKFHTAKGNKPYIAALDPETKNLLNEFMKDRTGYIFSTTGRKVTADAVRLRLKKALGNNYINPHNIRKLIATTLINNGASLFDVKEFLNHTSITTTQRYIKLTTIQTQQRIKKLHPMLSS